MSSAQLAAGTVLDGLTLRAATRGRAGAITYDAVDGQGRSVGVTVYDPSCFPSALVLERSLREIRQLQTIDHPRIAKVLACGKMPDGGTYEVHQPLPSASLAEHLATGPLATGDAIALAQQIGEALVEAQKAGVIHRNLGADVVFPSPEGVVVTGFAVGAPLGGRSFGALDSIAPEQVEGKVVDQRTLIYNLAALLVYMLRGSPLFTGEVATVLGDHLATEVPADVPHPLPRALAKDPRMRPMMLRQFLGELPGITGVAPRPGAAAPPPSSRGWTMFTSAVDTDATEAAAAAATPAVAAATPAAATPAAATPPPAAAAPAKPSSRGWTMFTQDDDGTRAVPPSTEAAAPSPPAPSPAAPGPAAPGPTATVHMPAARPPGAPPLDDAQAGAPPKPSTRGWTMFMAAADAAPDAAPAPTPSPVVPAPPAAAPAAAAGQPRPAAPQHPPDPDAPTPTTRGWTMFMTEDGNEVAAAAAPAPVATATVAHPQVPAAPPAPTPVPPPPSPGSLAPPPPATGEAKPSTRGWTMFTKAESDDAAGPAASSKPAVPGTVPAITVPTPPPAAGEAGGESPPSSRGWTLFMEPATAAQAAAAADAATPPPSATPPATGPATGPDAEAPLPGGNKRGWTMFMETPITEAGQQPFGPATPTSPVPQPIVDEASSDNRGWTVFGTPSPMPGGADPAVPTANPQAATVPLPIPSQSERTVVHAHVPARPPSGPIAEDDAPELGPDGSVTPRGKTIVAPGVQATSGAVGEVTGRANTPAPMPDTQYFRRGDISPERPTQRTTELDVSRPPSRTAAGDDMHGSSLAVGHEAPLERRSSGARTMFIVVGGLAVVGGVVAAVLYLT